MGCINLLDLHSLILSDTFKYRNGNIQLAAKVCPEKTEDLFHFTRVTNMHQLDYCTRESPITIGLLRVI